MRNETFIDYFSEYIIIDQSNIIFKNSYFEFGGEFIIYYPNRRIKFCRFFEGNKTDKNFKETFLKWL